MFNVKLSRSLSDVIKMCELIDFWPKSNRIYQIKIFTYSIYVTTIIIPMAISLIYNNGLDDVLANLYMKTIFLASTVRTITLMMKRHEIKQLEESLDQIGLNLETLEEKRILENSMKRVKFLFKFLAIFYSTASLGIIVNPLYYKFNELNYQSWAPCNWIESTTCYTFVYFYQLIGLTIMTYLSLLTDIFTPAKLIIVSALLDGFSLRLKLLGQLSEIKDQRIRNEKVLKAFVKCIIHHRDIISLLKLIHKIGHLNVIVQIIACSISLCVMAIMISDIDINEQLPLAFQVLLILVAILCQSYVHCHFGNDIFSKSLDLTDQLFQIEWIDFDIKVKKMMILFLLSMKKPLKFHIVVSHSLMLELFTKVSRYLDR